LWQHNFKLPIRKHYYKTNLGKRLRYRMVLEVVRIIKNVEDGMFCV
jgi:hypothetical protein